MNHEGALRIGVDQGNQGLEIPFDIAMQNFCGCSNLVIYMDPKHTAFVRLWLASLVNQMTLTSLIMPSQDEDSSSIFDCYLNCT